MILTVTANAALDITYDVPHLQRHASHRVGRVRQRAGGKGVNVASVLAALGHEVLATGLAGGGVGGELRADLDVRGIPHDFVEVAGASRRTVNVVSVDEGDATIFNEPGPEIAPAEWRRLLARLEELLAEHEVSVLVASGSLPPGVPVDGYAQVVRAGRRAGVRTILDAEGEPLLAALAAGPDVVKPNRHELRAATGAEVLLAGAAALQRNGARDVVVSDGPRGLLLVPTTGPVLRGRLGEALGGNPTGAGDALVAGLAAGLSDDDGWHGILARGVAWSAAAVLQPLAGQVDPGDLDRLSRLVRIEETHGAGTA